VIRVAKGAIDVAISKGAADVNGVVKGNEKA
jgi:hypothetical protein